MEDPKPVPNPQNPTQQNLPTPDIQNKKRKIDNANFPNSNFFKIHAIIKDLRPSFIQVLCAPDFRNSKAAHEIQKQMQTVMELSKQLRMETISSGHPNKQLKGQSLVAESTEVPLESGKEEKAEKPQPEKVPDKAGECKLPGEKISELQPEGEILGSYVIGGSPVGWNFMMYPGSKPVYYGETKASFVSRQAKSSVAPGT